MNRLQFIDRLRAWAARADNEVAESHGTARLAWQGQASVLRATASVASSGANENNAPDALRRQIIADRQKAYDAWTAEKDPDRVALLSGQIQGYELILTLLADASDSWAA